jgi:hypothetical protein
MIELDRLALEFGRKVEAVGVGPVARRARVDRSAVWRLRNGQVKRLSKGVRRLCKAVGLDADRYWRTHDPAQSRKLMRALSETWDGTAVQANAICSVLKAIGRVPRIVVRRTRN